jgi:alpha-tubulin suppressor-like RCC1 family protein
LDKEVGTIAPGFEADLIAVAAGDRFSCALTAGGAVSCWGNNEFGQLGDGTTVSRSSPAPALPICP